MNESKEDFEKLKKEQEVRAREALKEDGPEGLLVFTLENFAYRYLETKGSEDIKAQKVSNGHYIVESFELDPMEALKVSDSSAKKGIVELVKSFSSTKGHGLKVKNTLEIKLIDDCEVSCVSRINWNQQRDFSIEEGSYVEKSSSLKFDDFLLLRNKLALLLEEVCSIY